uniref:Uncharacterized protein n=1 Tax=Panagrolaimus superbus TaxID=310955 RepID=A0A914XXA1_9BILA
MYVWAAIYCEWEAADFPDASDWWRKFLLTNFFESNNIQTLCIYQCYRSREKESSTDDRIMEHVDLSFKEELPAEVIIEIQQ